uniref:RxLR effector candidate protein n=1 Tax=Hyaloperonospora arabidopsidis (strain Emoy2) TaxID=559515 RepID=M4BCF0_HYAAE
MRGAIANLQLLYQLQEREFSDCLSELSDNSRRTGGRDPQRQSSAGSEAPRCSATLDSRTSERGNSFAVPSSHNGSRYAPREIVDHLANPPVAVVGAGKSTPNRLLDLEAKAGLLERCLHDLRDRVELQRQERLYMEASVQRYRLHRSDDRSEFAFSQLENKRRRQAIRDEVADVRHQMVKLQSHIEKLALNQKNILEFLERRSCIYPRKKQDDRRRT